MKGGEFLMWIRHNMEGTRLYKIWDNMERFKNWLKEGERA